jgi:ABC-type multidrug transport system fused ATPase/permease subunit
MGSENLFRIVMQHIQGKARLSFFFAPLIMLGEVFCDLQQPTLMSKIIDQGLAKGDLGYVIHNALLMTMFAVLGLIFGGSCGALGSFASLKMGESLRSHLLDVALNDRQPKSLSPATLITRITNDVTQMQNLVMMVTRGLVRSPMLLFGGIVMSIIICPDLAPILGIIMPFLIIFLIIVVRRSIPKYTRMQQSVDAVNRVMRENLQGAKTIKAYVLENHQLQQFTEQNKKLQQNSQLASLATVILSPVIQLMLNIGVIVAIGYGGSLAISNTISDGQIIAFVNYMIQITTAMIQTVNIITAFSRAITSSSRVQDILNLETNERVVMHAEKMPSNSDIEFKNVSFGFNNSKPILNEINFKIGDGQWLGIIGETGSGKSSLINLLTRKYDDYRGQIKVGGVDIKKLSLNDLHRKIAVALQDSLLFSGNILGNLTYGQSDASKAALKQASQTSMSSEFIEQLPDKYQASVEQAGKNFSGGQRQRLNIARALVMQSDILVLDDATSAVDQTTNALIKQRLGKLRQNKTTLIVSQRVTNIMDCDKILVLQDGQITALGTHQQLLQQSQFYRQLVQTQMGDVDFGHA